MHTAETARALVIGETLAVQVVAMRQQRIGGRSFTAYLTPRIVEEAANSVGVFAFKGQRII